MNRKKRCLLVFLLSIVVVFLGASESGSDGTLSSTWWQHVGGLNYAKPIVEIKTVVKKVSVPMTTDQIIAAVLNFSDEDMEQLCVELSANDNAVQSFLTTLSADADTIPVMKKSKENLFLSHFVTAFDNLAALIAHTMGYFKKQSAVSAEKVRLFLRQNIIKIAASL